MSKFFSSEKKFFYLVIIFLLALSFFFTALIFLVEDNPEHINLSLVDVFLSWIGTITTAGTGIVVETNLGKIFSAINMLIGGIFYIAVLSEFVIWVKNKSEEQFSGSTGFKGSDHVLILGYNELALGLVHILEDILKPGINIVLVSSLIDSNPKPDNVKFVKRSPLILNTLEKVDAHKASVAFILSKDNLNDKKADYNAMLIAGHVEKINKEVFTLVEISDGRRSKGFEMFGIDETFTAEELFKDLRDDRHLKLLEKMPEELKKKILK